MCVCVCWLLDDHPLRVTLTFNEARIPDAALGSLFPLFRQHTHTHTHTQAICCLLCPHPSHWHQRCAQIGKRLQTFSNVFSCALCVFTNGLRRVGLGEQTWMLDKGSQFKSNYFKMFTQKYKNVGVCASYAESECTSRSQTLIPHANATPDSPKMAARSCPTPPQLLQHGPDVHPGGGVVMIASVQMCADMVFHSGWHKQ